MRSALPLLSITLVLAVAAPGASQPHVRPARPDACSGADEAYWVGALMDAIEDRAPFICACRARPGPGRVSVGVDVRAPGRVGDSTPVAASGTTGDEAQCVAHRVHSVAHAWLASTSPRLQPPPGTPARPTPRTFTHETIACPAPGGHDVQSTFSRVFMEHHPRGLRAGDEVPPLACRGPVQTVLEMPFSW